MLNSYLDLFSDVLYAATNKRYVDGIDEKLVQLGPIALFSNIRLTTLSGRHLEEISHAYIASFLHKLITSAKDTNDLSTGFDRDRDKRRRELTNNKN